ncbi:hypothetical protein EGJ52_24635 [Pseudomonas luteola]|nr:hypothetical protein EGJ52_24635 [Pseudomonas luteola]
MKKLNTIRRQLQALKNGAWRPPLTILLTSEDGQVREADQEGSRVYRAPQETEPEFLERLTLTHV